MAEEQVIIAVDLQADGIEKRLSEISNEMARVKYEQQQLNEQTKKGVPVTGEFLKQQAALKREMQELTRQQSNLTAAVQTSRKTNADYSDSLDGMRAKLNDMQKAYATLTKAQRESVEGQEFLRAIAEQDKAVKGLEQSIGDARRNVGDYEGAIKRAFPAIGTFSDGIEKMTGIMDALGTGGVKAMKGLVSGLGQATKASIKFIATPIGAVITAIVAAVALMTAGFKKLQEAFKKNDEAGTAMAKLFASFEPIVDAISRAFDRLASALGSVAERLANWLAGIDESIKAAQDLVVATDNLEQVERDYVVNSAKRNKDIAELRAEATQTEKYSAEERIALLQQAMELEKQNLEDQKKIAAERLRILEETARKESDTSDETTNKIAQARAALFQAEEQYYSGTRRLLSQLNAAEKEIAAEREERQKAALEAAFKLYEEETKRAQLLADSLDHLANVDAERAKQRAAELAEIEKLRKKAEEYIEEEEEEDVPSIEDIVRKKFGLDEEAISYYNELLESGMSAQERFAAMSEWSAKRSAKAFAAAAGSMAGAFNDMAEMLNKYGAENEKAQKAQKAFALAGIIASQAQSIAEGALAISAGIAQSQSVPFPANIAAIATTVATIMGLITSTATSFLQAKNILQGDAGAFEQGGVVGGTSYTGDRLTARVNSNEVILNPKQASNVLYQMANSPSGFGFDYEAMAAAMSAQPAPVVVYKELRDFESKVVTYNEIASI
jgi:DNA repair exonuclease SbcCD ATPase subunit